MFLVEGNMGTKTVKTSCLRDCFGGCSLIAHIKDGKIVKIEGGKENKATDGLICAKGRAFKDYVYSPNRVPYPMIRDGKRGEGKFKRVSWDFAIETIGEKLKEVKAKYGPLSLMYYGSGGCLGMLSEYYKGFFSQFGGYTAKKGNLCYSAGIEALKLTYGEEKHNAPWDVENAGLIILWGKNPANTNIQEMRYINNAISKGSKLITIDPIKTASTSKSHLHISPNPGTDLALALCIMNVLIERESLDYDFVQNYTYGFEKLKEHVKDYTVSKASNICGLKEEEIISLIKLIEKHKPMTIICGMGLQRYKNGGQTVRVISMIPALTGDIGKKGAGFRFANHQWDRLHWPFVPKDGYTLRTDYPASRLADAIEEYNNPPISMLWVERANPLVMNPDVNKLKEAFNKLDFIVVVEQFMTDTAKHADIVLPAQSFFEYTDIFTGYWTPYISCCQKAIEPYGEAKNESQIYRMLGKYMGYDMSYLPEYNEETLNIILKKSGINIDIEELKENPYMESTAEIAYEDKAFKTPSGKIELYCEAVIEKWGEDPMPTFKGVEKGNKDFTLRFLSTHARERLHSQFADIESLSSCEALLYINPKNAAERGIINGDKVEIFNSKGKIYAKAFVDDRIKYGVVNVYEGLSEHTGASVNMLTQQGVSDIGWGATFYECFVEVNLIKR
jgi:anaerobic selenocysteine-containing dehydrogenase